MVDLGIAPPPPPKLGKKEKSPEKKPIEIKKESKNSNKKDSEKEIKIDDISIEPKKQGLFKKMFTRKPSEAKQDLNIDDLDLDKLRADFGIPTKQQKSEISQLQNKEVFEHEKKVADLEIPKVDMATESEDSELQPKVKEPSKPKAKSFGVRAKLKQPKKEKFSKKKPIDESYVPRPEEVDDIDWTGGDIVDEIHDSKEASGWDTEEPAKIEKILKVKPKKVKVSVKKVAVKKATPKISKKIKVMSKVVKPKPVKRIIKTGKVDKVIEEYFKSVEQEQKIIQKELDMIVVHPRKALQKSPSEYIIHHNEKLIKSMKELLAALKSISDEEFTRNVGSNKKKFYAWVKGILENEKKAEDQRNKLLKQKMKEMFKEYGAGINKDIQDKKYELNHLKKENDHKFKQATTLGERMKVKESELKKKDKELNLLIEEGIQKIIDKRLKKEHASMKRAETIAGKKAKDYDSKAEVLKTEKEDFKKHKDEALQLLDEGAELKKLKAALERKDIRLKTFNDKLKDYEKELNDKMTNLETREKEAKEILKREETLAVKEKELELEKRDFETDKKSFELRRNEVREMEGHLAKERGDLQEIKSSLIFREGEAKEKLEEAKEIQHEIEIEEKQFRERRHDLGFNSYLHNNSMEDEEPIVLIDKTVEDFLIQVENCRNMVRNNQLDDAKRAYSEIRQRFSQAQIEPNKKEALYNSIRELYDDIYLAVISRM
ncbi:MAG: hypothetical protein ABH828_01985 [archaeon]